MAAFWQRGMLRVLLALGLALVGLGWSSGASAADPARGQTLFNGSTYQCASCHGSTPNASGFPSPPASYHLRFSEPWSASVGAFIDRLKSPPTVTQMQTLGNAASSGDPVAVADAADIYAYLIRARDRFNPQAIITPPASTNTETGTTLTFDGGNSIPAGDVTYSWSVRNPSGVTSSSGTGATQNVFFSTVGTYRVMLTVRPVGGGTSASSFVDINVTAAAQAIISSPANNTSVVAGTTLTLNGGTSTPVGGVTYQWDVRDPANAVAASGSGATQVVTFTNVGTYRVNLTVQPSGGGTPSTASINVIVTAPIVAQAIISSPANNTSVVAGTTLTVNGSTSTPLNGVSYQWALRDPANVTTPLGTASTQSIPFPTAGTYRVTLTVQPSGGGTASSTGIDIVVTAPPPVVAQAVIASPPASVVIGTTLTISGSGSTPANGVNYQWSLRDPANVTTQLGTAATQNVTFATVGTYRVSLTVVPTGGGTPSTAGVDVSVTPAPSVPTPVYFPSGFGALTGFTASTADAQTLCPTIQNTGTATLSLGFAAVQAAGSSADSSGYFELGDSAGCPATPRPCIASLPAGSPISGNTNLQAPADAACTLALRFNPAKFGAGGGLGARSATLRITHNAPAGTVVDVPLSGNVTAAPQPGIGLFTNPGAGANGRVSPPAFAAQPLNSASAVWNEFQVLNSGDADGLDITEVGNSNPQEFSLAENCVNAAPLGRASTGASCAIGMRFTPNALGERCTTVSIRAALSSNGAQSRTICGTGVAAPGPAMTLSADTIDFGRRFINAVYPPRPLVIGNGAGATGPLQINAITLTGSGFALVPEGPNARTPCVGTTLAAGASCTVQVQFTPDPARPDMPYSASIQIDTNDATPRRTVSLAAIAATGGTPPVLQFPGTPAQIEFANFVVAGQQSEQALSVTLRNAGPGAASIEAIRMVGADASSFSATGCPATLAEGDTCPISLRFVPGSGGAKRAQLEVLSSRSVAPPLVTVTGRAVGGTSAFLTTSSAGLALGEVRVGARSSPVEIRLASAGDGVVQVTGMEAEGPFTVQPKTCPAVPFTLPRGADCTVTVTFTPTDARAATASLRISTDADTRPLVVPLSGSGQAEAEMSSGGCSLASGDTRFDPTLWLLVILASGAIVYRKRARAARGRQP